MKNILVAYDGSETSKRAIDTAADLIASDARIHLDIVNVVSIPMLSDDQASSFAAILDLMKSDAEEVLADALNQFEGRHQQNGVDTLLVLGNRRRIGNRQAYRKEWLRHGGYRVARAFWHEAVSG